MQMIYAHLNDLSRDPYVCAVCMCMPCMSSESFEFPVNCTISLASCESHRIVTRYFNHCQIQKEIFLSQHQSAETHTVLEA